ncbi:MAG: META domain-containing protein [Parvularcula sp.]|nr:META domain-containing protein [Parvularcula sp.]
MKRFLLASFLLTLSACGSEAVDEERAAAMVTIQASVPEGTGTVYLSGNTDSLGSWDPAAVPLEGDGARRFAAVSFDPGEEVEYQFTLGDWWQVAMDEGGFALQNASLIAEDGLTVEHDIAGFKPDVGTLLDDPSAGGVLGTLITWRDVESVHLEPLRHVQIWLPPSYDGAGQEARRYPVIYMSDGQNLFDPRIANTGTDWGMDEAIVKGAADSLFDEAIIVSSWSTRDRAKEYNPWVGADDYARFLIDEIKPRVDREFRTETGPEATFAMGSSMGGLLAMHLVTHYPETFSACGCVSTHLPLTEYEVEWISGIKEPEGRDKPMVEIMMEEDRFEVPEGTRIFFDWGTETLDARYPEPHAALEAYLSAQGLTEGEDYLFREYPGAAHNEASWRARIEDQLVWLLAGKVPGGKANHRRDAKAEDLLGEEWVVESIAGGGIIDSSRVTLRFEPDGGLSGRAGCNRYTGSWSFEDGGAQFGPPASTRMACAPALMEQEQRFLAALEDANRAAIGETGALLLVGPDGEAVRARRESPL